MATQPLAPAPFDLAGRTVLVTGASSGIGRRFAISLAAAGAQVVVTARRRALLEAVCNEVAAAGGVALAVTHDASDEFSTIAAFDEAEARFGAVDSVVVNAGVSSVGSSLGIAVEDFDRTVAVNFRGAFLTAREAARRMIAHGSRDTRRGRITLISSITGQHPSAGVVPYAATKAAVTQMGRAMAKEWAGKGINVNVIAPGYMHTDMTDGLWDVDRGRALLAGFARGRVMSVAALDPILLYLCSDASAEVTGSVFTIDDGQTL